MAIQNSDGNYAVITRNDNVRVDVHIYISKAQYLAGINPFFHQPFAKTMYCGADLKNARKNTNGLGTGKVKDDIDATCSAAIEVIATADPDKFKIVSNPNATIPDIIKGDWVVAI